MAHLLLLLLLRQISRVWLVHSGHSVSPQTSRTMSSLKVFAGSIFCLFTERNNKKLARTEKRLGFLSFMSLLSKIEEEKKNPSWTEHIEAIFSVYIPDFCLSGVGTHCNSLFMPFLKAPTCWNWNFRGSWILGSVNFRVSVYEHDTNANTSFCCVRGGSDEKTGFGC